MLFIGHPKPHANVFIVTQYIHSDIQYISVKSHRPNDLRLQGERISKKTRNITDQERQGTELRRHTSSYQCRLCILILVS